MPGDEPGSQPPPADAIASGFTGLVAEVRADLRAMDRRHAEQIEGVRQDLRQDNARVEERVMSALMATAKAHASEHVDQEQATETRISRLETHVRNSELAQARKDGALGVFRYSVELIANNAKPIATVLTGIGVLIGLASGTVSVGVGR